MTRTDPAPVADERTQLTGFLAYQRETLRLKCSGLDAEQVARRAVGTSSLSLLGILRHLADVERSWFRRVVGGEDVPRMFLSDADFDGAEADPAVVDQAWAAWRAETDAADRVVAAAPDLDVTGVHHRQGAVSLRWVLLHMLEEYARHNGHADLLREAVDGEVGE